MNVDTHTHSLHSDGTTTPTENADLAVAAGLAGFALTDHDTTTGWDEAEAACAARDLLLVPGLELSCEDEGRSVHLLGYWPDRGDPELVAECARLRDERADRAERIVGQLAGLGVDVSLERVRAHAGGAPIGRPHLAAAMVEAGVARDVGDAFDRWLHDGGPAWVPKHALEPVDGLTLLKRAGAAVVLAHPGHDEASWPTSTALVDRLTAAGLDGVEAEHAAAPPEARAYWTRVAGDRGLVVTGASDFHGSVKSVTLGAAGTPVEAVEELRARARSVAPVGGGRSC